MGRALLTAVVLYGVVAGMGGFGSLAQRFQQAGVEVTADLLQPGARRDFFTLLLSTATVIPLATRLGVSPILGFLASGVALGPNGLGAVTELHTTEALAELGVVFFLFEMGLELSIAKLMAMKQEIFGLGLAQFVVTTLALMAVLTGVMGAKAAFIIGGALALSSSAFVLQLLRDGDELGTTHGRAALGVLLLQDLMVVPLLVMTPLLAQETAPSVLVGALAIAGLKAIGAVLAVEFIFKGILNSAFDRAARSRSQEAFLSVALFAVLGVSGFTASIGLSETLGAFLAGIALAETRYSSKIEADVAPFRGMLLGLFFVTVGFSMDLAQIASAPILVVGLALGLLIAKAGVLGFLGLLFRLPLASALRTGLLLAQGGEFGFVAFGLAERLGLLDPALAKLLVTSVALSMASTPACAALGTNLAQRIDERTRRKEEARLIEEASALAADGEPTCELLEEEREDDADVLSARTSSEVASVSSSPVDDDDDVGERRDTTGEDQTAYVNKMVQQSAQMFKLAKSGSVPDVVVCGYGQLGRVVCEMLDTKFQKYVVIEKDEDKAASASADGRPVFFGDLTEPEILDTFKISDARLVVLSQSTDPKATDSLVAALRRLQKENDGKGPEVIARAADRKHRRALQSLGIKAYLPSLENDSRLLSLPFAGYILRSLGFPILDIDLLIENSRFVFVSSSFIRLSLQAPGPWPLRRPHRRRQQIQEDARGCLQSDECDGSRRRRPQYDPDQRRRRRRWNHG